MEPYGFAIQLSRSNTMMEKKFRLLLQRTQIMCPLLLEKTLLNRLGLE